MNETEVVYVFEAFAPSRYTDPNTPEGVLIGPFTDDATARAWCKERAFYGAAPEDSFWFLSSEKAVTPARYEEVEAG